MLFVAGCLAAGGCRGGASAGVEVSGEVTFNGKPVPAGRIYFNPDVKQGNDGRQGYAAIHDGKFDTSKTGKPACGGPTVVVIQGFERSQDTAPGAMGEPLFKEYEVAVDLPREKCTRDFAVPAEAARDLPKGPRGHGP